jgi:hypothetical protein
MLVVANEEAEQELAAMAGQMCVTASTFGKVLATLGIIESAQEVVKWRWHG